MKQNNELRHALTIVTVIMTGLLFIGKFFPINQHPELQWLQHDITLFGWMLSPIVLMLFSAWSFQFLTESWSVVLRYGAKSFQLSPPWWLGLIAGLVIIVLTLVNAAQLALRTINLDPVSQQTGGVVPILAVDALLIVGLSLGWSLFKTNAEIANFLHPENPPFNI